MTRQSRITRADIYKISTFLKDVLEKDGDEFVKYKGNHSDASIAEKFKVTAKQVEHLRREVFGHIKRGHSSYIYGNLVQRIDDLEARVLELERVATSPADLLGDVRKAMIDRHGKSNGSAS